MGLTDALRAMTWGNAATVSIEGDSGTVELAVECPCGDVFALPLCSTMEAIMQATMAHVAADPERHDGAPAGAEPVTLADAMKAFQP